MYAKNNKQQRNVQMHILVIIPKSASSLSDKENLISEPYSL